MAKPEWGTKRICPSCGAKFYDFHRDPITCPACNTAVEPGVLARVRRPRTGAAVAAVAEAEPEEEVLVEDEVDLEVVVEEEEEEDVDEEVVAADTEAESEEEDEAEPAIEDVSELGDDDVTAVIETELDEETER